MWRYIWENYIEKTVFQEKKDGLNKIEAYSFDKEMKLKFCKREEINCNKYFFERFFIKSVSDEYLLIFVSYALFTHNVVQKWLFVNERITIKSLKYFPSNILEADNFCQR